VQHNILAQKYYKVNIVVVSLFKAKKDTCQEVDYLILWQSLSEAFFESNRYRYGSP
jgi:hypothetical protein